MSNGNHKPALESIFPGAKRPGCNSGSDESPPNNMTSVICVNAFERKRLGCRKLTAFKGAGLPPGAILWNGVRAKAILLSFCSAVFTDALCSEPC